MIKNILLAAGLLAASSAFAGTNLISNGNFSSNNIAPSNTNLFLYSYQSLTAAPWSFTGNTGVSANSTDPTSTNQWGGNATSIGDSFYAFIQGNNSASASVISQSFTANAGQYTISFALADRTNYQTGNGVVGAQSINVIFDNTLLTATALSPSTNGAWTDYSFTAAAANTGTQTLSFSGAYTGSLDSTVFLDNVAVTAAPVPEPAEGALLLSGMGLLGFVASRRKKSA